MGRRGFIWPIRPIKHARTSTPLMVLPLTSFHAYAGRSHTSCLSPQSDATDRTVAFSKQHHLFMAASDQQENVKTENKYDATCYQQSLFTVIQSLLSPEQPPALHYRETQHPPGADHQASTPLPAGESGYLQANISS